MAWSTPKVFTNEPLTAADMNTYISDNLSILKDPASASYEVNESSNYTTTSTTFTNVDGTDTEGKFKHTLTTAGGDVFVHFHGNVTAATGALRIYFELTMDGTAVGGDDGIVGIVASGTVPGTPVTFTRLIPNVSAGSHIFRLQWKVSSTTTGTLYAGAGTANADLHPQFWAREIS